MSTEIPTAAERFAALKNSPPYIKEELENTPYVGTILERAALAEQRSHHDYSPSTLQSLEACPCYQSKQSETPHPRTVIGTISHAVIENGEDDNRLTDEDTAMVAECIDFYERRKQLLQESRERAVQRMVASHFQGHEDHEALVLLAQGEVPEVIELKETYLPVDDLVFADVLQPPYGVPTAARVVNATTAGYIDCALIDHVGTYAELFDWKLGFWAVEPGPNNTQGIAYALGLFKKYPRLETVKVFFKQPNIEYVTDALFTRSDIPALYLRIQVIVAKARAARRAGDFKTAKAFVPACNFCQHVAECPVVTTFACRVGSKFFPLEIPSDITPTMVHSPVDTKLGLRLAAVLEVWAKAFKGVVTNRVITRDSEPPEGYTIQSRTPREIKDSVKYREVALRYLTEVEYASTLKASFGSVESLISDKAPRGQKKSQVEQFGREIEECGAVVKGEGYVFLRALPKKPAA